MKEILAIVLSLSVSGAFALSLEEGFLNPPDSAKPHTWYHMMNGNVTKEGITADFEALAKAGIGGVQMFDAGCEIPPGDVAFNSPEWFALMKHAAREARRLGLEICIPNCSGWSSSGGPWNMPSNGMKNVVFCETKVKGPSKFAAKLPRKAEDNGWYEDIAVLAYPVPPAARADFSGVTTKLAGSVADITSERPVTIAGLYYQVEFGWAWSATGTIAIETSDDGQTFRPQETQSITLAQSGAADKGLRFLSLTKPVTARIVRVSLSSPQVKATFKEVRPTAERLISDIAAKTFHVRADVRRDSGVATADQIVAKADEVDLTDRLAADGTLTWDVPAGEWTILRIGAICNGRCNHPASDHGRGLEVDKLSASAMDYHFEQYVGRLCRTLGPLAGDVASGLNNILVDSYEVGSQNWTQGLDREFERRMGYSLKPYLPVFTGAVVGSVDESERFLEDFRRVVADLFAENYAGRLAEKCHQYGLKLSLEPYGNCPADNLQYGQDVDIPMGEFWSHAARGDHMADVGNARFVSSVAHVWGRRYAATESFTASPGSGGRWQTTPFTIKAQGDRVYASGINRIIYHRFVHQPWPDDKYVPGMTMGRWGMHLDRHQTWWRYASAWFLYQTRCQWMLQEGQPVADVLFYCGEQAPNQGGNTDGAANAHEMDLPYGYASDVCATKAFEALKVLDGRVVTPAGVPYGLLVLPSLETMSERLLRKVDELVSSGAKVCGRVKPTRAPGLRGYPTADERVRTLAESVWGKGVLACTPAEALKRLGMAPDFGASDRDPKYGAVYLHRRDASADWYFVACNNVQAKTVEVDFRETGRLPEVWEAERGTIVPASRWRVANGRTYVTLDLPPSGSAFIVFRRSVDAVDPIVRVAAEVTRRGDTLSTGKRFDLTIESAVYGVLGDASATMDIAPRLRACCSSDGVIDVRLDNAFCGHDPAPMRVKSARVVYTVNGVRKEVKVEENAQLTLPREAVPAEAVPDWEWRGGDLWAFRPLTAEVVHASGRTEKVAAEPADPTLVRGPWDVSFPPGWGAPEHVVFPELVSWTERPETDIRYFSGTATYEKRVDRSVGVRLDGSDQTRIILDLGAVRNFAEVTVNGKTFPVLWRPPYRVDITDALQSSNLSTSQPLNLSIRVTNLWPNRLIGDSFLPGDCEWKGEVRDGVKEIGIVKLPDWVKRGERSPTGRHTFTTWKHWDKGEEPLVSGLLGPVTLHYAARCR